MRGHMEVSNRASLFVTAAVRGYLSVEASSEAYFPKETSLESPSGMGAPELRDQGLDGSGSNPNQLVGVIWRWGKSERLRGSQLCTTREGG